MRGQSKNTRTRRALVGVAAAGVALLVLPASPAAATHADPPAGETSGAIAVLTEGIVDAAATAPAGVSCTNDADTASAANANVPTLAAVGVLNNNCDGSASHADVANVNLLNSGLTATAVSSDCSNGTGSSSVATLGGTLLDGLAPGTVPSDPIITGYVDIDVSPLLRIQLNETTTNAQGDTVQNAIHISVLDNGLTPLVDEGQEIIIAQARCDAAPNPVIPEAPLALLLPLSALALFGGAFLVLRRQGGGATA